MRAMSVMVILSGLILINVSEVVFHRVEHSEIEWVRHYLEQVTTLLYISFVIVVVRDWLRQGENVETVPCEESSLLFSSNEVVGLMVGVSCIK